MIGNGKGNFLQRLSTCIVLRFPMTADYPVVSNSKLRSMDELVRLRNEISSLRAENSQFRAQNALLKERIADNAAERLPPPFPSPSLLTAA